jgi:hypothetical protein
MNFKVNYTKGDMFPSLAKEGTREVNSRKKNPDGEKQESDKKRNKTQQLSHDNRNPLNLTA